MFDSTIYDSAAGSSSTQEQLEQEHECLLQSSHPSRVPPPPLAPRGLQYCLILWMATVALSATFFLATQAEDDTPAAKLLRNSRLANNTALNMLAPRNNSFKFTPMNDRWEDSSYDSSSTSSDEDEDDNFE